MAVLTDPDRLSGAAEYMSDVSAAREQFGAFTKLDVRAAFNALDQYLSDNAASINSALPVAFRNGATTPQKARLMMMVIKWRYLKGV